MATFPTANRESDIKEAFRMISNSTCIQFKPRQKELTYLKLMKGQWFVRLPVCFPLSRFFLRSVSFILGF